MIHLIFGGVVSGVIVSLLGWIKHVKQPYDYKKSTQTIILGAIVGAFSGYAGLTYMQALDYPTSAGAITLLEYAKTAIRRRL